MADPLFILAPHRSFTSVVCAMLGQHPQMYGLPETNLFVTKTMERWWIAYRGGRSVGAHGLLRSIAQMYFGEQTEATIALARRWLWRRLNRDTSSVFTELAEEVHPLILVDKSPNNAGHTEILQRLYQTFPQARFLHLLRHPREQCESFVRTCLDFGIIPMAVDAQERWYFIHQNICSFLAAVPDRQQMRVRGEDLLGEPNRHLREISEWLGLRMDDDAIQQMKHPEQSPFARFGPLGARLGYDTSFLARPALESGRVRSPSLEGPLSWRDSRDEFLPEVKQLAQEFGYE